MEFIIRRKQTYGIIIIQESELQRYMQRPAGSMICLINSEPPGHTYNLHTVDLQ